MKLKTKVVAAAAAGLLAGASMMALGDDGKAPGQQMWRQVPTVSVPSPAGGRSCPRDHEPVLRVTGEWACAPSASLVPPK